MGLRGERKEAIAALLTVRREHPWEPLHWADGFSAADLVGRRSVERSAKRHGRPRGTGGGYAKARASQVALAVKNPPARAGDGRNASLTLGQEDPLEKEMETHSSILAWRIPWAESGGLWSIGSQRVRHD